MLTPEAFSKRILVAISGLSPQIVTETVYALAVAGQPAWVPTEIHLLTTSEGAHRARLTLNGPGGWMARLREAYGLPEMPLHLHAIRAGSGTLEDIRTSTDNIAAADSITALIRRFTADAACALHVSIAGGRKSMGFHAGAALTIFGREQDRLSHVLVSSPFESLKDFYFPTSHSSVVYTADNRPLDAAEAEVTLAEIPYLRVRQWVPDPVLEDDAGWSRTVAAAQSQLDPPMLTLYPDECTIQAGPHPVRLPPADFAFYCWLADRAGRELDPVACPPDGAPDPDLAREYLVWLGQTGSDPMAGRSSKALKAGMDKNFFQSHCSLVNRKLKEALGEHLAQPYKIASIGQRPNTRYGLRLKPEQLKICLRHFASS